jgi:ABC-type multidrug transport system ATPase subunit
VSDASSRPDALDFSDISVEQVSRSFGRRRALSRVSFRAAQGEILGILGPNGAGKSTLLAILADAASPDVGARSLRRRPDTQGAALRARIGVLGHDLFLYPELTARENLGVLCRPARGARTEARRRRGAGAGRPRQRAPTTRCPPSRAACVSAWRSSAR